jgi:hypothetical protein
MLRIYAECYLSTTRTADQTDRVLAVHDWRRYSAISVAVGLPVPAVRVGPTTRLCHRVAKLVAVGADGVAWANGARRVASFWGSGRRGGPPVSPDATGLSFGNKSG